MASATSTLSIPSSPNTGLASSKYAPTVADPAPVGTPNGLAQSNWAPRTGTAKSKQQYKIPQSLKFAPSPSSSPPRPQLNSNSSSVAPYGGLSSSRWANCDASTKSASRKDIKVPAGKPHESESSTGITSSSSQPQLSSGSSPVGANVSSDIPYGGLSASRWANCDASTKAASKKGIRASAVKPQEPESSTSAISSSVSPVVTTVSPDLPFGGLSASRWATSHYDASTQTASWKTTRAPACKSRSEASTATTTSSPSQAKGLVTSKYAPKPVSAKVLPVKVGPTKIAPPKVAPYLPFGGMAASKWAN